MKPHAKIAILCSPDPGERGLLRELLFTQTPWISSYESVARIYSLTIGMPPTPGVHGAIVFVKAEVGVTMLLRRALWHAKRRGVKTLVGLIVSYYPDELLLDAAETELRDSFQRVEFPANEIFIQRLVMMGQDWKKQRADALASLFATLDAEASYQESPVHQATNSEMLVRRLFTLSWNTSTKGEEEAFSATLWEQPAEGSWQWRLWSIVNQALHGFFDDVPDLWSLASDPPQNNWRYFAIAKTICGLLGTRELISHWPWDWTSVNVAETMKHWMYLSSAKIFIEELQAYRHTSFHKLFLLLLAPDGVAPKGWQCPSPEEDITRYLEVFESLYQAALSRTKDENAIVLYGEHFSVARLAEHILRARRARPGSQQEELSLLFVAQTGLSDDTATIEGLLARGELDRFAVGARYFAGNLLPEYANAGMEEPSKRGL